MDRKGRPICTIPSIEDDLEAHVIRLISQNMQFEGLFVRVLLQEMQTRTGLSCVTVMQRFEESPIIDEDTCGLVERGLKAYFKGDPLVALHLLVPPIEAVVRELAALIGCDTYRPNRYGGMNLRLLDDLLRDPRVEQVLTTDVTLYLRVLLTDLRGLNLRNRLCHGMLSADECGHGMADRVFHVLMLLSSLRASEEGEADMSPEEGADDL
jgi:hypothetical protein